MQKEIETFLIKEICEEFENVILNGIEEEKEKFIYFNACVEFLRNLKKHGLSIDINYFSEYLIDKLYKELKAYLGR